MFKAPRGTKDLFAQELYLYVKIKNKLREIFYNFNFDEIQTPIFENTELFTRSSGKNSDIVTKEMYTFLDKSNRSLTLKPEGTAPVVRSAIENNLFLANPKLFYFTPAFRYERPQSGRYREFYQCGCESFGVKEPICDAEIISLAHEILLSLKIKNVVLKLNSIGCENCRKDYNLALKKFLDFNIKNLCNDCQKRFESNPLRILDCKNETCQKILINAPSILDFLCNDCVEHFNNLKQILKDFDIKFDVDSKIVRGLDYYTRTVFEFVYDNLTICGGGRYDNLVSELGGKQIPAVGFGFGLERLISVIKSQNLFNNCTRKLDLYIATLGQSAKNKALIITNALRKKNFSVECDISQNNIKSQIKKAIKLNSNFFVAIGEQEISSNILKIKNMNSRLETEINIKDIDIFLAQEIKN